MFLCDCFGLIEAWRCQWTGITLVHVSAVHHLDITWTIDEISTIIHLEQYSEIQIETRVFFVFF